MDTGLGIFKESFQLSQVPTQWNFSDIGTKSLKRERTALLMGGVGAVDPVTLDNVGQEEWDHASERGVSA